MAWNKTSKRNVINAPAILEAVCREYDVALDNVIKGSRGRNESDARSVAALLLARRLSYGTSDIARYFRLGKSGGKYLLSKAEELFTTSSEHRRKMIRISTGLKTQLSTLTDMAHHEKDVLAKITTHFPLESLF